MCSVKTFDNLDFGIIQQSFEQYLRLNTMNCMKMYAQLTRNINAPGLNSK